MANRSLPSSASVNVRSDDQESARVSRVIYAPSPFAEVVTLKWKAEGIKTAITAIRSKEAFN
jgi:hypothetical protein